MNKETPTILVVDDDSSILEQVAEVLKANGYNYITCTSAEEGLEYARSRSIDLIVSDINLGDESGLTMCESIREIPGCAEIPVMFLSGAQIPNIIRRSHEAGGTYYLRKPFDPEVLIELIEKGMWMPHLVRAHMA